MYLKKIELVNIGAYKGYNSFNFETEEKKNVLLVGGENGAGKTTLLNAIKLGLFGSYGLGYKTENSEYYKHVSSILNNHAKRQKNSDYSITIHFSIVDNLKTFNYELKREWKYVNDTLKEIDFLVENGNVLDAQKTVLFYAKLKEFMPPQLLDFCLFDGEEIARIVTQNKLSDYIKKLSKVVFNLDLFETLEIDLENYSKQQIDPAKAKTIEHELFVINTKEKELRNDIATTTRSIDYKQKNLNDLHEEYLAIKTSFEQYGGLKKQEREDVLQRITQIETERKQRLEEIKNFVSNVLPLFLTKSLLTETRNQVKNEESLQLAKQLDEKLTLESLTQVLQSLNMSSSKEKTTEMKEQLVSLLKPKNHEKVIHGASYEESLKVEQAYTIVQKDLPSTYLELLTLNANALKEAKVLKDKIKVHDETDEFSKIIEEMDSYNLKIVKATQDIEQEQETLQKLKNELVDTLEKIEKIKLQLRNYDKTSGSLLEAQKIIALSRKYREQQIAQRLQDVQIQATSNLKKMLRKHDYIALIRIDPVNYEVTLLDTNKNEIEKRTLSAGEKQMLLISIIWAIFDCSGRQVPFIFDTLLGRLDKTHKAAVLSVFIPNFGKQAIILSTDSEIDAHHYALLSPSIAKEYTLDFDPIQQQTTIKKDYFKFS